MNFLIFFVALFATSYMSPVPSTAGDANAVSIVLIADVQYTSNGIMFWRDYRSSLKNFRTIQQDISDSAAVAVVDVGDLIEDSSVATEDKDYSMLRSEYSALSMPVFYAVGNNDQAAALRYVDNTVLYHTFTVLGLPDWLFVVLNTSEGGRTKIGNEQLAWLESTLEEAWTDKKRVMIFGHVPPRSSDRAQELSLIFSKYENIAGYISGHTHSGNVSQFAGVPQIDLKAVLTHPESPTYAELKIFPDRWEIVGMGIQDGYYFFLPESFNSAGQ